jgi:hypothetical protein
MMSETNSSFNLLASTLRYIRDDEAVKDHIGTIAAAYDPSHEINPDAYDSPWRSLALIFSLTGKSDLAQTAFDRAINWFETVTEGGTPPSKLLLGARLTMQALCLLQAGQVDQISGESLKEAMRLFDDVIAANSNTETRFWQHLQMNYGRLSFLANRFNLDDAPTYTAKAQACYQPSRPIHHTISFLPEEIDLLRRTARLAIEVADSSILNEVLIRLLSFTHTFQRASLEGDWKAGNDLGVFGALKAYLVTADLCVPNPSEASRAVGLVTDFLIRQNFLPNQSIHDRAPLLLARSFVSPTVGLKYMPEITVFWQEAAPLCTAAAKQLGLNQELLSKRIGRVVTDFVEANVARFFGSTSDLDTRKTVIQSLCLIEKEGLIPIWNDAWRAIAKELLRDLDMSIEAINTLQLATAAEKFGSELRMRIDQLSLNTSPLFQSHLNGEALISCERFFETSVEKILLSHDEASQTVRSLQDAATVYTYSRLDPGTRIWDTVLHCLQSGSPSLTLSVLTSWILNDRYLTERLWSNLRVVLISLSERAKSVPSILFSDVAALLENNQQAVLTLLFGNDPELQEIMLPVVHCVLDSKDQLTSQETLLAWIIAAKTTWRSRSDHENHARKTLATLLKAASENSSQRVVYEQASRALIARRLAVQTTREHSPLIPIVAKLLVAQVMTVSPNELEQYLLNRNDLGKDVSTDLVEAAKNLLDQEAVKLLDMMSQHTTSYSLSEFYIIRNLVLAILSREFIRHQLGENPDEEQRNHIAQMLIRYFPPSSPTGDWSSWSRSGDPEKALSHDKAFTACRHLVGLLLCSSKQIASYTLASLGRWDCTTIWGLVRWLADVLMVAEQSIATAEALSKSCRECLTAILTSESSSMTYYGKNKEYTVSWREKADLPPIIAELILPHVLEHSQHVVSSLPQQINKYAEQRQILCSAVPTLASAGVLTPLCADLVERILSMDNWGQGRSLCLAFIKEAFRIETDQERVVSSVASILKGTTSKKRWTTDQDVVSLLCGLPGKKGKLFTELLYECTSPSTIVNDEKLWKIAEWISSGIEDLSDLSARLKEMIEIAQVKASNSLTSKQGLGAWATVISAVCSKTGDYRSTHIPLADVISIMEFVNTPLFGRYTRELWAASSKQDKSTSRAIDEAIRGWERITLKLINEAPDKARLSGIGIPWLLRLRELQMDFRHVHDMASAIMQADLVIQNPELVIACIDVCLEQQDLDSVETILRQGMAITAKSSSEAGAIFLVNALSSFWHLGEISLSWLLLESVFGQLRTPSYGISEEAMKNICKLASEQLWQNFKNPPDLLLLLAAAIEGGHL